MSGGRTKGDATVASMCAMCVESPDHSKKRRIRTDNGRKDDEELALEGPLCTCKRVERKGMWA